MNSKLDFFCLDLAKTLLPQWSPDKKNGKGTLTKINGSILKGVWKKGKFKK